MDRCKAINKTNGKRCPFNAKEGSRYCGTHEKCKADELDADEQTNKDLIEKPENLEDKIEELKNQFEKESNKAIIYSCIIALIGGIIIGGLWGVYFYDKQLADSTKLFNIGINNSIELYKKQLNETYWSAKPVTLELDHELKNYPNHPANSSLRSLQITVKNTHPSKETGELYIYRLEKDKGVPFDNESSLGPNESRHSFILEVKKGEVKIKPSTASTHVEYACMHKPFRISYKISCDNCPPEGFTRTFPPNEKECVKKYKDTYYSDQPLIDTYEWVDHKPEEVLQTNESINIS